MWERRHTEAYDCADHEHQDQPGTGRDRRDHDGEPQRRGIDVVERQGDQPDGVVVRAGQHPDAVANAPGVAVDGQHRSVRVLDVLQQRSHLDLHLLKLLHF